MKKIIYILGVLVIALNLFFSLSLKNNITIDSARAKVSLCSTVTDEQSNYSTSISHFCTDNNDARCGIESQCLFNPGGLCIFEQCDLIL